MNETVLTAFVIVASIAIIFQAAMLAALFFSFRKTSARVEKLADTVESKAIPLLESAKTVLDDTGPRIKEITDNLSEITGTMKAQVGRMDTTVTDLVDRARLQIIRVDELVSRTMDKVEETTEMVQQTVVTPVKHLSGIMQGLSAGIGAFLQKRHRRAAEMAAGDDEELFI